jgi:hypothetical protein
MVSWHWAGTERSVGCVVYALDDLNAWADLGAKTSTSDPGAGNALPAKRVALPDTGEGVS